MNKVKEINIVKANGEEEPYSREKFRESLRRANTEKSLIDKVQEEVEGKLEEGMTTEELYNIAQKFLAQKSTSSAAKYSLKKAIMELGPAGYLFEKYFAAILSEYGYKTKTNLEIKGECVTHEIDVLAEKEKPALIIEAKYHNSRGTKSDIQTILYTYARFLDIKAGRSKYSDCNIRLATNTKFTNQAIKYAECRGIKMHGWHYPKDESLEKLIEDKNLYPVTVLPSVNNYARGEFAKAGIYFARELKDFSAEDLMKKFDIYKDISHKIEDETNDFIATIYD